MDRESTPLKQIRTFQGDVAEALQKQRESLISIQQKEHLKGDLTRYTDSTPVEDAHTKRRKEVFLLFMGSLVLLMLGAVGAWFTYREFVRKTSAPMMVAPANRLISTQTEVDLDFATTSRELFFKAFSSAKEDTPAEQFRHIVLRRGPSAESPPVSVEEFLKVLGSHAPGSLVRAFNPLFMLGSFRESSTSDRASTFLIIKLVSFENAFAGMLLWEKNLSQDIGPLFATIELSREVVPESVFTDIVDRNKDIRMLSLGDQPILLYAFFERNFLVITDSIETLRVIGDHLTREQLSR